MEKQEYSIIGVMSGTSLDGIDLVHCTISAGENWDFKLHASETVAYPKEWQEKLSQAVNFQKEDLKSLNLEYTEFLAGVINTFITRNSIENVDAVSSHGHTVKHEPDKGFTLQIGNLEKLAALIDQTLVCDFRVQDVAMGGEGAPLVPVGDALFFNGYKYCLNLGGFANISTEVNSERVAYDISPVNTVLNYFSQKEGKAYDENGNMARDGDMNQELLEKLNALDFYHKQPPKSLGIEWVNQKVIPLIESFDLETPSILKTFCLHIAFQISESLDNQPSSKVLITGGGAFNDFLIETLEQQSNCSFTIPEREIVEFKEALIFALLGVLKLRGEVNVLKSVTGAEKDHSSGMVFKPSKK
ncbi:anhydro-N-acetylmuramic acid kinase [Gramella sp. AN32]|uniref:Anhydro-N-acetylmuramic acid kinase n=1 Tax=Christiangramia antarctica TaxID=2058158 RepID=A0ABW5X4K9_9FLAO|nr:anhydro-N-acetylmuramic acid kinase [Gramella sp. AN32]MCM4157461.1 anhydro-N-acetylmuramic acid kinase [Gramella sp. AN32]